MRLSKAQFAFGVASAALAAGISSQAQAACTTSGTTVTCADANTIAEANAAVGAVAGSDVTLNVNAGATLAQPGGMVQATKSGAVVVSNNGTIGSDTAAAGILYIGDAASQDNSFVLTNRGRITGAVNVLSVGGSISLTNAGEIGNAAGLQAITAVSAGGSTTSASTTTSNSGGVTTTTEKVSESFNGGTVEVAIAADGSAGTVTAVGVDGANVTVDGVVGSVDQDATVVAVSSGSATTTTTTTTSSATGGSTSIQVSPAAGGDATVGIGATGQVHGSVTAVADGSATVTNAGAVLNGVIAASPNRDVRTDYQEAVSFVQTSSATRSTDAYEYSESYTVQTFGGEAFVTNERGGAIIGNAIATGVGGASVENSGRIDGNITGASIGANTSRTQAYDETSTYNSAGVLLTRDTSSSTSDAQEATAGEASFINASSGLIVGSVSAIGDAGVEVENGGVVTGTTTAISSRDLSASSSKGTTSYTLAADGTETTATATTTQVSDVAVGGNVQGVYSGTNGAYQYAPTGASDGSVTQVAAGDSSAAVTGTIIGNFYGAGAAENTTEITAVASQTVFTPATADTVSTYETAAQTDITTSTDYGSSESSLAVNGGTITGDATLYGSGGASVDIGNGGAIDGSVFLSAQYDSSNNTTSISTTSSEAGGTLVASTYTTRSERVTETGTGDVSLTVGDADIGGSANLIGAAGETVLTVAADGQIGGSARLDAVTSQANIISTYAEERTAAGFTGTSTYSDTVTASGGNVTASVDGVIGTDLEGPLAYGTNGASGDLRLLTSLGNASATITGQVANSIAVISEGVDGTLEYTANYVDGGLVADATTSEVNATGGTASLDLDSASGSAPVNFGDIEVAGFAGSTLTVSAGTSAAAGPAPASVQVGNVAENTSYSSASDYVAGTVTGSFTETAVGGASSLINDGQIGFADANHMGAAVNVEVESATDASATNNGSIFGSIEVAALGYNRSGEWSSVNVGDVTQVTTNTTTYVPYGGTATLNNNGLITGSAQTSGAEATLTNNGVIRGSIGVGGSVENAITQAVDTFAQLGEETLLEDQPLFLQSYTVDQNGVVGGTIAVGGAFGQVEDADGALVQTSDIQATVNLNQGSVTLGGVHAQYDDATAQRFTTTNVNLVGDGHLGLDLYTLGEDARDGLIETFEAIDPAIDSVLPAFAGARVLGVENLTKTGSGAFRIVGADMVPANNVNPLAAYTLDVGTFAINEGEVQLATAGDGVFGIRGDVVNNAGLVLGTRVAIPQTLFASNITSQGVEGINGVSLYQQGNFTQTDTGTLTVGMMPSLVRVFDPSVTDAVGSNEPLGVGSVVYSQGLFTTPELAYGAAYSELTPSSATIDGDLTLAGTIDLVAPTGGLFLDGQGLSLFSVSGAVDHSAASVEGVANNFVTFNLVDTTDGDRTIVSVVADRAGYETAAANSNAAAAGAALTAALPAVAEALVADANGQANFASVEEFGLTQDLATVMAGLDSRLTMAGAAAALDEMATGSYYGSITSLRTTAPFADVLTARRVAAGTKSFNVWMQPSGDFTRIDGRTSTGARKIHADNYGGSAGFGVSTGSGEFGLGFGYGEIKSHSGDSLTRAKAKTWMAGVYARQGFGPLTVAGDFVLGWSNWDATRLMPTLSREAEASFDSKEVRADLRVEYAFDLGAARISPFGQLELRHYDFDGFAEEGAGGIGLAVDGESESVFTPTLGVKAEGSFETEMATLRPMLAVSYSFKDNNDADRTVAFLGAPSETFRLRGVDQKGYVTFQGGLFADIGNGSGAFLNGSYSTGGGNDSAGVKAGVVVGF